MLAAVPATTLKSTLVVLAQILELDGAILNCGNGLTVKERLVLAVQELAAVTVTEYKPLWFVAAFEMVFDWLRET